jgi:hypothetical protein
MILYGAEMGVDLKFKSVLFLLAATVRVIPFVKVVKEQRYNLETNNYLWVLPYTIVIDIGCFFCNLQQFEKKKDYLKNELV